MGVVRDIIVKLEVPNENSSEFEEGVKYFETHLRNFIDWKNRRRRNKHGGECNDDTVFHVSDDKLEYAVTFDRGYYDSYLFFMMRLIRKSFYETGVTMIFDADGDGMDERMTVKYLNGRFVTEFQDVYLHLSHLSR